MQPLPDLTCVVVSWGSWFNKYGQDFIKNVTAANPQPTEFLFLTDKLQEGLPNNFRQVLVPDIDINNRWRYALEYTRTGWWCCLGLDDLMPADGFRDLVFDGDIVLSAWMDSNGVVHTPTKERYDSMFEQQAYQMQGWWMARVGLDKRIPKRPIVWEDWVQWFEFKMHEVDVRFDPQIRMFYRVHREQFSNVRNSQNAMAKINLMRELVQQGNVKPGAVWPPELL
jgi:hypothetical protein